MRPVILVNGVPASGKSTVARALAEALGLPAFGIDTVKEALFAHLGTGSRDHNRLLGRASYQAIFATIGGFPPGLGAIVEAWHGFQPRSVIESHLERAGSGAVVEIWCHAPPSVVAERYRSRAGERHAGHPPASYAEELRRLAETAVPLGIAPVIDVDTTTPLDVDGLARQVRATLD